MFSLNWNLYNKSVYDFLKEKDENEILMTETQQPLNKEQLIQQLEEQLTEEEKYELAGVYKSKDIKVQNDELKRVKKEAETAKLEGLLEGRQFGNYEGIYKMIRPHIGKVPHHKENIQNKRDDTLLQLDNLINIKIIDAFDYEDMEKHLIDMALDVDEKSVDGTFFNRETYGSYRRDRERTYKDIVATDKRIREIDSEFKDIDMKIKELDKKITPVKLKKDGSPYKKDIGKQNKNDDIEIKKSALVNKKKTLEKEKQNNEEKMKNDTQKAKKIVDKQIKYKDVHIRDKTLEKITNKGPFDALKDGIKIGNSGQLFVGPAFKDYQTNLFSTENIDKLFNEKLEDFKKNIRPSSKK